MTDHPEHAVTIDFTQLNWLQFEHFVGSMYRAMGYHVTQDVRRGRDGGIDLEISKAGHVSLVQCKHYTATRVGEPPLREMYGLLAMHRDHRHRRFAVSSDRNGIIITTSRFTADALDFARSAGIECIDRSALEQMLVDAKIDANALLRASLEVVIPIAQQRVTSKRLIDTHVAEPASQVDWSPSHDDDVGREAREELVRKLIDCLYDPTSERSRPIREILLTTPIEVPERPRNRSEFYSGYFSIGSNARIRRSYSTSGTGLPERFGFESQRISMLMLEDLTLLSEYLQVAFAEREAGHAVSRLVRFTCADETDQARLLRSFDRLMAVVISVESYRCDSRFRFADGYGAWESDDALVMELAMSEPLARAVEMEWIGESVAEVAPGDHPKES